VSGVATPLTTAAPPGSQSLGMMFWYHALAGRMDEPAAWIAALAWAGDSTIVSSTTGRVCMESTISSSDEAGTMVLKATFDRWLAAAPAESSAAVEVVGPLAVKVSSCDPGVQATTRPDTAALVAGGASAEHKGLAAAVLYKATLTEEGRTCVALKLRTLGLDVVPPLDVIVRFADEC
jgi:hypothetical protein